MMLNSDTKANTYIDFFAGFLIFFQQSNPRALPGRADGRHHSRRAAACYDHMSHTNLHAAFFAATRCEIRTGGFTSAIQFEPPAAQLAG